jgi:drug/metabolite transporter (DMT)-like permease
MHGHRLPVDALALTMMVVLCVIWGFQQITIKWAIEGISPLLQAGLRSLIALVLLLAWARLRGIPLFRRDGTLISGLIAGVLFAGEFMFIYAGLAHTNASRMIVFVYLAPCVAALGLTWLVPAERLNPRQWAGVLVAFGGVALAFAEGFGSGARATLLGDLYGVIGAVFWGATTVLIRVTRLARASATKTLFYQLAVSAAALPLASFLAGESGIGEVSFKVAASLAYQGVIVAFASYLAWFWLLAHYLGARISVFSFLTPLFGVMFGVVLLSEPLSAAFLGAALLVGAGIALVNLPRRQELRPGAKGKPLS